jgi:hypothetical protein
MLVFRQAAAMNAAKTANAVRRDDVGVASASLFPATGPRDEIPIIRNSSLRAGGQGYDVTGWRPPAPSQGKIPGSSGSGGSGVSGGTGRTRRKKGMFGRRSEKVGGKMEMFGKERDGSVVSWVPEKQGVKEKGCVVM